MELEHASHIFGRTIMRSEFSSEYAEIESTLRAAELPLRPAGPYSTSRGGAPKRQRRGNHHVLLPADLKQLNLDLDAALRPLGWTSQPVASEGVFSTSGQRSKGDFAKNGVFVEVEFGNTASLYRDLFKFQVAAREGVGRVGVLVAAVSTLARFHDSGITTFEKLVDLRPYLALVVQMPIWIVGLRPESFEPIRARYGEMLSTATDNGQTGFRSFDDLYQAPTEEMASGSDPE